MRTLDTARTSLIEAAKTEGGLYRGRLAEAYDGIGQYVLVSLASSSVAAAYKARVAAGDFGGGRTFPRGTPVTVAAHRGNLEVFLGNNPQPCVYLDNFNRNEINTLGDATTGDTWGFSSGAGFVPPLVNGSEFEIPFTVANRSSYAYFDGSVGGVPELLKQSDAFGFRAKFKQTALVASGSDIIRFLWYGPGFSQEIRVTIFLGPGLSSTRLNLDGGANNNFNMSDIIPDTWYIIHLDVKPGVYGRMNFYAEDDGPPDTWQIDAVDTGLDISASPLWDFTNELQNGQLITRYWDYLRFCPPLEP